MASDTYSNGERRVLCRLRERTFRPVTYSAACGSALSGQSRDCERELTLAEKLAVHHYRGHAALQRATARGNAPGEEAGAQRAEAGESKNRASLACLSVVLQELDLLEASVSRVRPQRAARGAKKLQSSFGPPDTAQGNDCGWGNTARAMLMRQQTHRVMLTEPLHEHQRLQPSWPGAVVCPSFR